MRLYNCIFTVLNLISGIIQILVLFGVVPYKGNIAFPIFALILNIVFSILYLYSAIDNKED